MVKLRVTLNFRPFFRRNRETAKVAASKVARSGRCWLSCPCEWLGEEEEEEMGLDATVMAVAVAVAIAVGVSARGIK